MEVDVGIFLQVLNCEKVDRLCMSAALPNCELSCSVQLFYRVAGANTDDTVVQFQNF